MQFRIALAVAALGLGLLGAQSALASGFYVATSFGPNWDGESSLPFVSEDTGLAGMVALGTHVDGVEGLRFELEASYRTHDSTVFGFIPLEHDTTAFMANVAYDFSGMDRFVPYVMVGAGMAHTELTVGGLAPLTIENDGFAYQVGAGVNYRISDSVALGIGYNYMEAPDVEVFGFELDGGSNHGVKLTATIATN